ncbi:Type III effector HopPmaH [Pseudomonas syringae pv. philadelphi]|uniref:Type III effector HopPmaH n=1 Tax=Pseudomonas syringae pv. philadelphi TaxID=251706 RepID=A0A3M3ZUR5_9PSED|nr:type III helper protein HopAK1 [Pseudomonas syringae group genomosp. 3]RMO98321.1 Type III effector HopPmaH [Pseudomonas syringae pv. philadelphi]
MNTINRNVYPVSGLSTQSVNPETDGIQPPDVKSGHNSQLIDFSSPQQVNGLQSSLSLSGSRPQVPATSAASDASENPVELLLNKLVEAIRNILKDLLSLFKGDQQQDQAPPPAQTQREQAPSFSQLSQTPSSASPSSPSAAPASTPTPTPTPTPTEKPFVVQNDHPADKPVTVQKNTAPTPPDPVQTQDKTSVTAPPKPVAATPAVQPKATTPVTDKPDAEEEKVAKPAPRAAHGQGADMSGMIGFAKEANTTGGNSGEVVTVNTVADLKKYMEDDTARTVKLGANLSADSKVSINFGANKTLLGTDKGNSLHNIYLASGKTASNDIFQNLNFTHDSRYRENGDMQMFISSGQKYWIDHITATGTKDQNPKGLDKLLYVGGKADNVSLTNSKFQNNEYGVILGQPDDSAAAKAEYKGYPRMTIANNVFSNLDVRAPGLMRHGQFDVFNNSIDDFHLGFTATGDATILSQANYFAKGVDVSNKASNSGVLDDYGDAHFKDIGSNVSFTQKSPVTAWTPSYNRDIKTAEAARADDLANAGAEAIR